MINAAGCIKGTVEVDGMGEDALDELSETCKGIGISLKKIPHTYKKSILIFYDIKTILIFSNARPQYINSFTKRLKNVSRIFPAKVLNDIEIQ